MYFLAEVLTLSFVATVAPQLVHQDDLNESRPTNAASPHKSNLCDRVQAMGNGTLELRDALQGLKIQAAVTLWDDGLLARSASGEWSGLYWELMSELAALGQFEFELNEHPFADDMDWEDWLHETIDLYDINVDYWTPTPERTQRGALPVFGMFETSTFLATHAGERKKVVSWLSFLRPLAPEVWYVLLGLSLLTALAYAIAECGENEDDLSYGIIGSMLNSTFLSFLTITGSGTFAPKTWSGKIIVCSWAWYVLLFVSTYTANLAAFLIVEPEGVVDIVSLDNALANGKTVCVWNGTPQEVYLDTYVQKYFPKYQGKVATAQHPMKALLDGDCDAALGAAVEVSTAKSSLEMNPCCTLETVGEGLTFTDGAWFIKNDYSRFCTALVRDVLYVHSVTLKESGVLAELFQKYLNFKSDHHCTSKQTVEQRCPGGRRPADTSSNSSSSRLLRTVPSIRKLRGAAKAASAAGAVAGEENASEKEQGMGLDSMAGMCLIHASLLVLGILPHVVKVIRNRYRKRARKAPCNGLVRVEGEACNQEHHSEAVARKLTEQNELLLMLSQQNAEQRELLAKLDQQQAEMANALTEQGTQREQWTNSFGIRISPCGSLGAVFSHQS